MNENIQSLSIPSWSVKNKSVLIQKNPAKGNAVGNYRSTMAWIDFRKDCDMVPYAGIIKVLKPIGAAPNVIALLKSTIIDSKTKLISGDINLGEVSINRDSLSPLHFVISLISLTVVLRRMKQGSPFQKGKRKLKHLLFMDDMNLYRSNQNDIDRIVETVTKDVGMKFDIDKRSVSAAKRGNEVECHGIKFENGEEIGQIEEEGYNKYLGNLQKDDICQEEMKKTLEKITLRG